ncbi:MAG: hypothetical protein DRR08_11350 [Candidatus Parabeggiatoa sp. nov. 2]|nr:MAG: hypothetical protein B6247_20335 [Beggiatoa sp. 4572_84]RKZ60445.1 MAG: hypothetical protein DRR08_11350 [Gammaproteobacteria bacterium]
MNSLTKNGLKRGLIVAATFSMPLAWAAENPDDGLIVHYQFEGNLNESSGNGNHGHSEAEASFTSDRFGKSQNAISLNGNTVISIADSTDKPVLTHTTEFTVSAWVSNREDGVIIQQGGFCPEKTENGTSFRFNILNGKLKMLVFGGSGSDSTPIESNRLIPQDGTWHHLAGIFDNGKMTLYIDGEKDIERTYGNFSAMADSIDPISIGHIYSYCGASVTGYANKEYAFSGDIDDLRLYKRALSAEDIQAICCQPVAILTCENPEYRQGEEKPWRVDCDASESYDADGHKIEMYLWQLDSEGQVQSGPEYTFKLDAGTTHTLKLRITDDEGESATDEQEIFIPEQQSPVAKMTAKPTLGVKPPFTVNLDGRESSHPDGLPIISYAWKASDGQTASGETATMTFAAPGEYTMTLTVFVVSNNNNIASTNEAKATVIVNAPPTADFTLTETPVQGTKSIVVKLNASASYDPDGGIDKFEWQACDGQTASGKQATLTLDKPSNCAITLTVTDNQGATDSHQEKTGKVYNQSPSAQFDVTLSRPSCGGEEFSPAKLVLDANASNDPDGDIKQYDWVITCPGGGKTDCTDGKTVSGVKGEIPLTLSGDYTITLTVTDEDDLKSRPFQQPTTVESCRPLAAFSATNSDSEPLTVNLDASVSKDWDGTIKQFVWDTCNGQTKGEKATVSLNTYNPTCYISLTITDNEGKTALKEKTIAIPTAQFTTPTVSHSCTENQSSHMTLDARDSYDRDGKITQYHWAICPGGQELSSKVMDLLNGLSGAGNHTGGTQDEPADCSEAVYTSPLTEEIPLDKSGLYTITLTVTDNDGLKSGPSHSKPITVKNCSPIADFTTAPAVIKVPPFIATLDANSSVDYNGEISGYEWESSEGKTADGKESSLTFETCGEHTITLKVTDNDNAVSKPTTKAIKVNCPPEAVFTAKPQSDDAPLTRYLDASQSYDKDGDEMDQYDWQVICAEEQTDTCSGFQQTRTGKTATVALETCGTYDITLSVTDELEATGTTTQRLEINCLPVAAFTPHVMFGNLPVTVKLDARDSCDKDGTLIEYNWAINGNHYQTTSEPQTALELRGGDYTITLTVTDNNGGTSSTAQQGVTIDKEEYYQRTFPYNNTARLGPQIIAAGVTPSKIDLKTDDQFYIVALVRPGLASIRHVSFQDAMEARTPLKMTRAGVLPNGDEIYKAAFSSRGLPEMTFSTAWGSGLGQFNIIAVDEAQNEQKHTYPYLRIGNFPKQNIEPQSETPITYSDKAREAPQVIMAGYSPAILDFDDDQFDVIAIVRAGKLPIKQVVLKQNAENLFHRVMTFVGELENGDQVYKVTYTYERGALGIQPYDYKDLWGPDANQFGIEVVDEGEQRSHQFPDIEFGHYPEWKKTTNIPTNCDF